MCQCNDILRKAQISRKMALVQQFRFPAAKAGFSSMFPDQRGTCPTMAIKISDQFDGGAIEVVSAKEARSIDLRIRKDSHSDFLQWFYFRLQGARDQACTMRFLNAGDTTYPQGWVDYQAVASYDGQDWFRVPTVYDGKVMTVSHTPEHDSVYYAYFEPYSFERHLSLVDSLQASPLVRVEDLCNTVDGRDLNLLVVGDAAAAQRAPGVLVEGQQILSVKPDLAGLRNHVVGQKSHQRMGAHRLSRTRFADDAKDLASGEIE